MDSIDSLYHVSCPISVIWQNHGSADMIRPNCGFANCRFISDAEEETSREERLFPDPHRISGIIVV
jgi:hypothetical protein